MIPTAVTQLSFWEKFAELQYKMIAHAPDAPQGHMFASEPSEWPLLVRSIAYWLSPNSNVSFVYSHFYCIRNWKFFTLQNVNIIVFHQLWITMFIFSLSGTNPSYWKPCHVVCGNICRRSIQLVTRNLRNSTTPRLFWLTPSRLPEIQWRWLHFILRLLASLPTLLLYRPHFVPPSLFTCLHIQNIVVSLCHWSYLSHTAFTRKNATIYQLVYYGSSCVASICSNYF